VRAPQRWHADAIRAAFGSADDRWTLTAIFCTRFVKGFDAEILHALSSRDPDVHYEAVVAAGAWGIGAAWPHIVDLVASESVEKSLRLAAIEAVPSIRPDEARTILGDLLDSDDEEVVEAVEEALAMAEGLSDDAAWKDDEDE
jgi:HEAT repeat protein